MSSRTIPTKTKGESLAGKKITYLKDKFAESPTQLLVMEYDSVHGANKVLEVGKKEPFYEDVVKLVKEKPSCHVEQICGEDMTAEYCAASEAPKRRREAAVKADGNLRLSCQSSSDEDSEDDNDAPAPPRQQQKTRPQEPQEQCVVCIDAPRTIVNLPCRHACFCQGCAATAQARARAVRQSQRCPICRANVVLQMPLADLQQIF